MTLAESASRAVLPWNSLDAENPLFETLPQQRIDICLMCPHSASACDSCKGDGNPHSKGKRGRPKAQIDSAMLKDMLKLRRCNADICRALKISENTLLKAKRV